MFKIQAITDFAFKLALFYIPILIGYLFAKYYERFESVNKVLTKLLLNIMLPILVLQTLLNAPSSTVLEVPAIIIITILIHFFGIGLMLIRFRTTDTSRPKKGALLLCAGFNNGIFLPVPLILMFIGEVGIAVVAFYSIAQMTLITTIGPIIAAHYSGTEVEWQKQVKKAVTFPPFLTVILGIILLFFSVSIPMELNPFLFWNGQITTYLSLFVVGIGVGSKFLLSDLRAAVEAIGVRQLLVPLLIAAILVLVNLSNVTTQVLLLQAMMPPAVITVILSAGFDLDHETAATAVTIGTLLLLPVIPFFPLLFS
ncbi:MAG: conserved membrane protein of unknown function [Candidatus Thorarchaeota archaeon]|nr:MAG: conserved membrane protein of unknown function [Candidatus Thorarchaeota archaeon]